MLRNPSPSSSPADRHPRESRWGTPEPSSPAPRDRQRERWPPLKPWAYPWPRRPAGYPNCSRNNLEDRTTLSSNSYSNTAPASLHAKRGGSMFSSNKYTAARTPSPLPPAYSPPSNPPQPSVRARYSTPPARHSPMPTRPFRAFFLMACDLPSNGLQPSF